MREIAFALLASAASFVGDARTPPPGGTAVAAEAAERSDGIRVARSYDDLRGGMMLAQGLGPVQIEDFQWGLDAELRLVPAYVVARDSRGNRIESDTRTSLPVVFNRLSEMGGFFGTQAGSQVWVERIAVGLNPDGFVVTAGMEALTAAGAPVRSGVFLAADGGPITACACIYLLGCSQGGCSVQNSSNCAAFPCPCNPGTGRCQQTSTCSCPSNGYCPSGSSCQVNLQTPGTCACQ